MAQLAQPTEAFYDDLEALIRKHFKGPYSGTFLEEAGTRLWQYLDRNYDRWNTDEPQVVDRGRAPSDGEGNDILRMLDRAKDMTKGSAFIESLEEWYHTKGFLTPKQLAALKKTIGEE